MKHGLSYHPLYETIKGVFQRCYNPRNINYKYYGAVGITAFDEWRLNRGKFIEWAVANGWQPGLTLDRIDNNKGYYPDNCRFVTMQEQANNKRRHVIATFNGMTMNIAQWAKYAGVPVRLLRTRYKKKGNLGECFYSPIKSPPRPKE